MDKSETAARAIADALIAAGQTSRAMQAATLGADRPHWIRYVVGRQRPTTTKIHAWIETAAANGCRLRLSFEAGAGWRCEVLP